MSSARPWKAFWSSILSASAAKSSPARSSIQPRSMAAPLAAAGGTGWAVSTWYDRPQHIDQMRRRAMAQDFSWERAARAYRDLYLGAYERRRGHAFK